MPVGPLRRSWRQRAQVASVLEVTRMIEDWDDTDGRPRLAAERPQSRATRVSRLRPLAAHDG
jgi:hypothetical protein